MVTFEEFSIGCCSRGIGVGALRASGNAGFASPRFGACERIVGLQMRAWAFVTGDDR